MQYSLCTICSQQIPQKKANACNVCHVFHRVKGQSVVQLHTCTLCDNIRFDVQSYIIHVRAIIIPFDVVKRLHQKASNSMSIIVFMAIHTFDAVSTSHTFTGTCTCIYTMHHMHAKALAM